MLVQSYQQGLQQDNDEPEQDVSGPLVVHVLLLTHEFRYTEEKK